MLSFLLNISHCPICSLVLEEGIHITVDMPKNISHEDKSIWCPSADRHYYLTQDFLTISVLETICIFHLKDQTLMFLMPELNNNQQLKDELLDCQSLEQFTNKLATYLNFA